METVQLKLRNKIKRELKREELPLFNHPHINFDSAIGKWVLDALRQSNKPDRHYKSLVTLLNVNKILFGYFSSERGYSRQAEL